MSDLTEEPVMHGSPSNIFRDETVTPPNQPVVSNEATETESFRRVSDALEVLQLNIDSHMRDIHSQRIDVNNTPNQPESPINHETPFKPPSASSSQDSSPPTLGLGPDQLLPPALYQSPNKLNEPQTPEETPRSASSSPDSLNLPIMQFETSPASATDSIGQPVSEPLENSEPESFEAPVMLDIASVRKFSNPESPESFEVPIMLDIASVRAFSNPADIDFSTLPRPDSFEVDTNYDELSPSTSLGPTGEDCNIHPAARLDFSPLRSISQYSTSTTQNPLTNGRSNDYFLMGNGYTEFPQQLQQRYPPGCMVQAWPLHQQILVAIPVDQLRPVVTPTDQQQHRVPPWIALTEQGALVRSHPPIRLDGSMDPMTQVQWNPSQDARSPTSAVTSHSANVSGRPNPTIPGLASDSSIHSLHASQHGQPPVTVLSVDPGRSVETTTVCYQLAFIAPEDIPGLTTPPASTPNSDSDPSRNSFRNNSAFNSDTEPRLRTVGALPRFSSSPSVLSSVPVICSPGLATSPASSFRDRSPTGLSLPSSLDHAFIRDQAAWQAIEAARTGQDPRATVFLSPLASFVATPSGPPALSPPLPGKLEMVNHAAGDSKPFAEKIKLGTRSSMEFSDSDFTLSSAEPSPAKGEKLKTFSMRYSNGLDSPRRRFPIDGADD